MPDIFLFIILLTIIGITILILSKDKSRKLGGLNVPSYKVALKTSAVLIIACIFITFIIYLISKSFEVTITIGVFLLAMNIYAGIYGLLRVNQTKRFNKGEQDKD